MKLKIGSRKSPLALWQTNTIADMLHKAHPDIEIEIVTMDTLGDKTRDVPLPTIGAKGLFTFELEEQLLNDGIDLAVHSLKDLPGDLPEGLIYGGSPERAAPTDAFISPRWTHPNELPKNAVVATGSTRRKAQLLAHYPHLKFVDLRGNIDTRLRKLEDNGWDAIIMATAALKRLNRPELIATELPAADFVPAVGQGAIGIEMRAGRDDIKALLEPILHADTVVGVTAERTFLQMLDGGCSVALGAYCYRQSDGLWNFYGWVGSRDGTNILFQHLIGDNPNRMARETADKFIADGANTILRS